MASINGSTALMEKATKAQTNLNKAGTKGELDVVLKRMLPQIAMALPSHFKANAERYARQLITLHSMNKSMQQCTMASQIGGLMTAAQLGLDLAPQLGQCYIIPRGSQATFQLGYKGVIALAMRSGTIKRIYADVVREGDEFEYSMGLDEKLHHVKAAQRGEITHVYALAKFTNGGIAFDVWTREEVASHAARFSASKSGPWKTDWESMAKKTLILAIAKYLPVSTEIMQGFESDSRAREVTADTQDIMDAPANFVTEEQPDVVQEAPVEVEAEVVTEQAEMFAEEKEGK